MSNLLEKLKKHIDYDVAVLNSCKSEKAQIIYLISIAILQTITRITFAYMLTKIVTPIPISELISYIFLRS